MTGHFDRHRGRRCDDSPAELYHVNSKLTRSDQGLSAWIGAVNETPLFQHTITRPRSRPDPADLVALPPPVAPPAELLHELLARRRSTPAFADEPISMGELSYLLEVADGVTHVRVGADGARWSLRSAPSGGGLYPVDIYCAASRVDGLDPGLYRYEPLSSGLAPIAEGDALPLLRGATYLEATADAAVAFLLVGVLGRSSFKYGERGYRFVLLEAGHIAQNLLLAVEASALAALPVGGFVDDELNGLLRLDGVQEAVLYLVLVAARA